MARPQRQIIPDLPNHIVTRGNNRRRLFSYPRDYRSLIWHVGRALEVTGCALHAGTLMTNHAHLLVTPPSVAAASEFVKKFSQRYAQLRNAAKNASGKLFEQRFFSEPVENELQLALTTMYIDANQVRAGIVHDALDYRWSTYAIHAGEPERSEFPLALWTPSPWYLQLGRTPDERAGRYRELFAEYLLGNAQPKQAEELKKIEVLSEVPYGRRLRRPDESRANEGKERGDGAWRGKRRRR